MYISGSRETFHFWALTLKEWLGVYIIVHIFAVKQIIEEHEINYNKRIDTLIAGEFGEIIVQIWNNSIQKTEKNKIPNEYTKWNKKLKNR